MRSLVRYIDFFIPYYIRYDFRGEGVNLVKTTELTCCPCLPPTSPPPRPSGHRLHALPLAHGKDAALGTRGGSIRLGGGDDGGGAGGDCCSVLVAVTEVMTDSGNDD